ncbi:hypothetical protein LCGC14_0445870 [marine sediment metagenome]|uniref:Uncharacterized protein n=1 Tax=marine sediment metagenome TaxID=412755 RepID=A0A0F9SIZ6_9ZZZZ
MPWFCDNCAEQVAGGGHVCTIWRGGRKSRVQLMNVIATCVPPLDGFVRFNDDGSGITRLAQREYDALPCKRGQYPKRTQGVRPPGWGEALERISERAAAMIANGVDLPEC